MHILFNGAATTVADQLTVAELLRQFQLKPDLLAVEVNLELVPRSCHAGHRLQEGDRVEVVTLVGGG